ncbi:MAG TPA: DUF397 domain-containing protein [Streptosporangiaceae bacterium]
MEDQVTPRWRKSSYSGNGGSDCIEVATRHPGTVAVRDSKNPHGPVLTITPDEWASFIASLRFDG